MYRQLKVLCFLMSNPALVRVPSHRYHPHHYTKSPLVLRLMPLPFYQNACLLCFARLQRLTLSTQLLLNSCTVREHLLDILMDFQQIP